MPLWRRRRSVADGFSLPASAQGDTFSARLSEMQATTSQTRPTLTQLQPEIHVVCFLTRYRSAWAEYNLFPIKSTLLVLNCYHPYSRQCLVITAGIFQL